MSTQPDGTEPRPPGSGAQSFQTTVAKVNDETRKRSPFMFAVIGLCFFLPFVSISCSGTRLATLSGVQLVTGAEVDVDEEALTGDLEEFFGTDPTDTPPEETPGEFPLTQNEENDPSIWAIVALAAAVIGVVYGFVRNERARSVGSFGLALIGLAGLIALRIDLQGDLEEGQGFVSIDYRMGYWITAVLFAVLAIAHGSFLRRARKAVNPATGPPGPSL